MLITHLISSLAKATTVSPTCTLPKISIFVTVSLPVLGGPIYKREAPANRAGFCGRVRL